MGDGMEKGQVIKPGEVVGRMEVLSAEGQPDNAILVLCLECRGKCLIERWRFRRALGGRGRACDACMDKERAAGRNRQVVITKQMHEALSYIGKGRHPMTGLTGYCGPKTLKSLLNLGVALEHHGIVWATPMGLDLLAMAPRWSLTSRRGREVAIWGLLLLPSGTLAQYSTQKSVKAEAVPRVLDRDLSGWLDPTTEVERKALWEALRGWEAGGDAPAIPPMLLARVLEDADRFHRLKRSREE